MSYQTLEVKFNHSSYPIYVGEDIFAQEKLLAQHVLGHQVLIVSQENVADHYLSPLKQALHQFQCNEFFLPNGDSAKNLNEWQRILETLLHLGYERSCTLIALGGGVVGDITGFAAACYQRGVSYIQIPTTLMAQVDSSIGGKTAVNHPHGKNMIGVFHQPKCVIADVKLLETLPQEELISGLAEVIKYGLIADANFFAWLEENSSFMLKKNTAALLHAVSCSAAIKAEIVSMDEREHGIRALLNFGHTFGHALETACAYQGIRHGEAVALGMMIAAELSFLLRKMTAEDLIRIKQILGANHLLSVSQAFPSALEIIQLMKRDKKVQESKINLILLNGIGKAEKMAVVDEKLIGSAIGKVLEQ